MGIWRVLGYGYAAITIFGGILLLASGFYAYSRIYDVALTMSVNSSVFSQLGSLALIYGGLSGITLGIVLIWALVKSRQIENIDKNIKIIAEWAKSQMQKEGVISKVLPEDDKSESIK